MRRIIGLVVAVLVLSGCAVSDSHDMDHGMMDAPTAEAASGYSTTDVMFAEMMIPHHQQAIVMSELALTRSQNADVIALAKEIRAAQAPEIEQMKSWGADGEEHMGHQMMGMLSDAEIDALKAATGTEFDQLFLKGMIAHHEGAIDMAQMILASKNDEVRTLGEAIVSTQTAEIERMKSMLAELG